MQQYIHTNIQGGYMTASKKNTSKDQVKAKPIENIKSELIEECKKLATFKVSSAARINELAKELIKAEEGVL